MLSGINLSSLKLLSAKSTNLLICLLDSSATEKYISSILFSVIYLFRGGYRANIYTDAIQFFIMFIGFFIIVIVAICSWGGIEFLQNQLPAQHLTITGEASPTFIVVWFLIALWTFADPGFHQRCYSARTPKIAKFGIIISIFFCSSFMANPPVPTHFFAVKSPQRST